jgi:hypothetical protein
MSISLALLRFEYTKAADTTSYERIYQRDAPQMRHQKQEHLYGLGSPRWSYLQMRLGIIRASQRET